MPVVQKAILWQQVLAAVYVNHCLVPPFLTHGLYPPDSSVHGDSLHENPGVGSHSLLQGNLLDPGIEPGSPALQADALPSEPPGKHACSRVKVIYRVSTKENGTQI